jgi:hypothetical protein
MQSERTDRTGLPAQHCKDSTARDRTFRAVHQREDSWERTARKGESEQDRPTSKTGQADDGMQISV